MQQGRAQRINVKSPVCADTSNGYGVGDVGLATLAKLASVRALPKCVGLAQQGPIM
ncbi:MAG: hypothetical protein RJA77_255, partial [Pseudomonadota bacterium]